MPRPLIVAGMHRSGLGLATALAEAAGARFERCPQEATLGPETGVGRTTAFADFHASLLAEQNRSALGADLEVAPPGAAAAERARRLIQSAGSEAGDRAGVTGLTDPRATLFLDFWAAAAPDARFLLVYRHPAEVALSLMGQEGDRGWRDPWPTIRAWRAYNECLARFTRDHRSRVLLVNAHAIAADSADVIGRLRALFELDPSTPENALALRGDGPGALVAPLDWRAVLSRDMSLFDDVERLADARTPLATVSSGLARVAAPPSAVATRARAASERLLALLLATRPRTELVPLPRLPLAERLELEAARASGADETEVRLRLKLQFAQRETRHLADRLTALEGSRALAVVRAWWALRSWRPPALRPGGWRRRGRIRAERCIVGCVAEAGPLLEQALRLVRSWRFLSGELARSRFVICVVGPIAEHDRAALTAEGAEVRQVEPLHARYRSMNRLRFFEGLEDADADLLLSLDCDTIVAQDPLPWLDGEHVQARVEDLPTVPLGTLASLFERFHLTLPEIRLRTTFERAPTIEYCNGGVVAVPRRLAREFTGSWLNFNRILADRPELTAPFAHHCHQTAFTMAIAETGAPFRPLPVELNLPLHLTHLGPPRELLRADPVILHYHDRIDGRGRLERSGYPRADLRVAAFNRMLDDVERGARLAPVGFGE